MYSEKALDNNRTNENLIKEDLINKYFRYCNYTRIGNSIGQPTQSCLTP